MNYYQFHLGDYSVSTRGLSWDEHCAYRMLIDLYYAREEPISLDRQRVYRQTMARSKRQKAAIDQILVDYFTETPEGWVNERCERDLAAYRSKGERAQQAGMASAAARRAKASQPDEAELLNERSTEVEPPLSNRSTDAEQSLNRCSTGVQLPVNACSTTVQPTNNHKPITKRENPSPLTPQPGGAGEGRSSPTTPAPDPAEASGQLASPARAEEAEAGPVAIEAAVASTTAEATRRKGAAKTATRRSSDPIAWQGVMVDRPPDVPPDLWRDFCALRKARNAPLTARALDGVRREAAKAGATVADALAFMVERGHQGFIVEAYLRSLDGPVPRGRPRAPVRHEFAGLDYGTGGRL